MAATGRRLFHEDVHGGIRQLIVERGGLTGVDLPQQIVLQQSDPQGRSGAKS